VTCHPAFLQTTKPLRGSSSNYTPSPKISFLMRGAVSGLPSATTLHLLWARKYTAAIALRVEYVAINSNGELVEHTAKAHQPTPCVVAVGSTTPSISIFAAV
jgi:hypothetical protein